MLRKIHRVLLWAEHILHQCEILRRICVVLFKCKDTNTVEQFVDLLCNFLILLLSLLSLLKSRIAILISLIDIIVIFVLIIFVCRIRVTFRFSTHIIIIIVIIITCVAINNFALRALQLLLLLLLLLEFAFLYIADILKDVAERILKRWELWFDVSKLFVELIVFPLQCYEIPVIIIDIFL